MQRKHTTETLIKTVVSKSFPVTESGCWIWCGAVQGNGYGSIKVSGVRKGAHRVSYEVFKGQIPDGYFVCHSCDMPLCVNPDHLFVGSCDQNNKDRAQKRRSGNQHGSRNHQAKLTDAQVSMIRRRRVVFGERIADLAKEYGVRPTSIGRICSGKSWKHITF